MNNNLSRLKAALAYILVILLLLGGIFLAVRFIRFGVNLKPWEETSAAEETSSSRRTNIVFSLRSSVPESL